MLNFKKRDNETGFKPVGKRPLVLLLITFLLISAIVPQATFADLPDNNGGGNDISEGYGKRWDGIDFESMIGDKENGIYNGIYYGTYKHVNRTWPDSLTNPNLSPLSYKEYDNPTPILWRVMGEEADDGYLTLFSEYVLDGRPFNTHGNKFGWSDYFRTDSNVRPWLNSISNQDDGFLRSFGDPKNIATSAEYMGLASFDVSVKMFERNTGEEYVSIGDDFSSFPLCWRFYFSTYNTYQSTYGVEKYPLTIPNQKAYLPWGLRGGSDNGEVGFTPPPNGSPSYPDPENYSDAGYLYWDALNDRNESYLIGTAESGDYVGTLKTGDQVSYWTRSPNADKRSKSNGDYDLYPYYVNDSDGGSIRVDSLYAFANYTQGIRPLVKLMPENVIFTHEIVSETPEIYQIKADKTSPTQSSWDYAVSENGGKNYKLTILNDSLELNELYNGSTLLENGTVLPLVPGGTITLNGKDFNGTFLAYKIVYDDDTTRSIVAYGHNNASDDKTVLEIEMVNSTTDGNNFVDGGDYTLYVWTQENVDFGNGARSFEGSDTWYFPLGGGDEPDEIDETIDKITVEKVWQDSDDADGKRPDSVNVTLYAGTEEVPDSTIELNESNNWEGSWEDHLKNKGGIPIVYTVKETKADIPIGYTSVVTSLETYSFTVTNSYTAEKTGEITVKKVWNDDDAPPGTRPASINVTLTANGADVSDSEIELKKSDGWEGSWPEQLKNSNGIPIVYSIRESDIPSDYVSAVTSDDAYNFTVTNTYVDPNVKTTITVIKEWNDDDNSDDTRPAEIEVALIANGVGDEIKKLNQTNGWSHTWVKNEFDASNDLIIYEVEEKTDLTNLYTSSVTQLDGVFTITNSLKEIPTKNVTVIKEWDDDDNRDGKRPISLKVQLVDANDNDKIIAEEFLTAANSWTYTWTDLPTKIGDHTFSYSVEEEDVSSYTKTGKNQETIDSTDIFNFTNSYTPEKISLTVVKEWDDKNNEKGKRPDSLTVKLMNGDTLVETLVLDGATTPEWTATTSVPVYKYENGAEINYKVVEDVPADYKQTRNERAGDTITITNKYVPENKGGGSDGGGIIVDPEDPDQPDKPDSNTDSNQSDGNDDSGSAGGYEDALPQFIIIVLLFMIAVATFVYRKCEEEEDILDETFTGWYRPY